MLLETRLSPLSRHVCAPSERRGIAALFSGSALVLEELVRALVEGKEAGQADSVQAMLQARISGLRPEGRKVVLSASVLGQTFWHGSVAAVLGNPRNDGDIAQGLKQLKESEIIQAARDSQLPQEAEYFFRHALMRDAAYSLLRAEDLRIGHQRAAEFLESCGITDPVVLGTHWERAGMPARALPYLIQAAFQSLGRSDALGALVHAERGRKLGASGVELGELTAIEAIAHTYMANFGAAIPALDAALQLTSESSSQFYLACFTKLGLSLLAGRWEEESALAARFFAAEPPEQAIAAYVSGVGGMLSLFGWFGRPDIFKRFYERFLLMSARAPLDPMVQAWQLWAKCWERNLSGASTSEILTLCGQAHLAFENLTDWRIAGFISVLRAQLLATTGEFSEAIAQLRAVSALAQQQKELLLFVWASALLIWLLADQPSPISDEAVSLGQRLLATDLPSLVQAWIRGGLARAALFQGQLREAEQEVRAARSHLTSAPGLGMGLSAVLAESLLRQARYGDAREEAAAALDQAAPNRSLSSIRTALRLTLAQAHAGLGNRTAEQEVLAVALSQIAAEARALPAVARPHFFQLVSENARACTLARERLGQDPFLSLETENA